MARLSEEMRHLIHHISTELTTENVKGLCFLFGVSNISTGRCRCCSQQPLDVLEYLLDQGFYTQNNLSPLVEALEELGRNDLASECGELPPMPPAATTDPVVQCTERDCVQGQSRDPPPPPAFSISPSLPSHLSNLPAQSSTSTLSATGLQTSISPVHSNSALPLASTSSPETSSSLSSPSKASSSPSKASSSPCKVMAYSTPPLMPRTVAMPTKATPTKSGSLCLDHIKNQLQNQLHGLMEKRSRFVPRMLWRVKGGCSRSCDDDGGYVMVDMPDHASSNVINMSQSFDSTKSHSTQLRKQQNVVSKEGVVSDSRGQRPSIIMAPRPPLTDMPTFQWQLQRREFFDSIFHHDNKPLPNKVTVNIGAQEDHRTLTFDLRLYPNGVNWDQDTSASLQVDISGPCCPSSPGHASPHHASCTLYMEVVLVEMKKQVLEDHHQLLAWRRQVCRLREKQGFILSNFIPHEVIKNSSAESFLLLFNVNLSYSLGEDWIWVGGASEDLGLMVDL